jgi:hypothetical protein
MLLKVLTNVAKSSLYLCEVWNPKHLGKLENVFHVRGGIRSHHISNAIFPLGNHKDLD